MLGGADAVQRRRGEELLLRFKELGSPYGLCSSILKESALPSARFHAAQCMRAALVREWDALPEKQLLQMAGFLFDVASKNASEVNNVRVQMLLTVAVIVKLSFAPSLSSSAPSTSHAHPNTSSSIWRQLFPRVQTVLKTPSSPPLARFAALVLVGEVLSELSWVQPTSTLARSAELHFACARHFQAAGSLQLLLPLLFDSLAALSSSLQPSDLKAGPARNVLAQTLIDLERLLGWRFILPGYSPSTKPPSRRSFPASEDPASWSWARLLAGAELRHPKLLFRLALQRHVDGTLVEHVFACLKLYASLDLRIFDGPSSGNAFLAALLEGCERLFAANAAEPDSQRVVQLAQLTRRLFSLHPHAAALRPSVVVQMGKFTCQCLARGLQAERTWMVEAFDDFLRAWVSLASLDDGGDTTTTAPKPAQLVEWLQKIYQTAVVSHFSASSETALEEEDRFEDEGQLADFLASISILGRCHMGASLALLLRHLSQRTDTVMGLLQKQFAEVSSERDGRRLLQLQDELYWLLLVATSLLTDPTEGEEPQVPRAVEAYSDRCGAEQSPNALPKLVEALFRVAQYCLKVLAIAVDRRPEEAFSGLVCRTWLRFATAFSSAYLMRSGEMDHHYEITPNLQLLHLYQDPQRAKPLLACSTALARCVVSRRETLDDPPLVLAACELVYSLSTTREIPKLLYAAGVYKDFVRFIASAPSPQQHEDDMLKFFPTKARLRIVTAVTSLTLSCPAVFRDALVPLVRGFCQLAGAFSHSGGAPSPVATARICVLLDCLRGIPLAASPKLIPNVSKLCTNMFPALMPLLRAIYGTRPLPVEVSVSIHKLVRDIVIFQIELLPDAAPYLAFLTEYSKAFHAFAHSDHFSLLPRPRLGKTEQEGHLKLLQVYLQTLRALAHPQVWAETGFLPYLFRCVDFVLQLCKASAPEGQASGFLKELLLQHPAIGELLGSIICQLLHSSSWQQFLGSPDGFLALFFGYLEEFFDHPLHKVSESVTRSISTLIAACCAKPPSNPLIGRSVQRLAFQLFHQAIFGPIPLSMITVFADALFPLLTSNQALARRIMDDLPHRCRDRRQAAMLSRCLELLSERPEGEWRNSPAHQKEFRAKFGAFLNQVRPVCR